MRCGNCLIIILSAKSKEGKEGWSKNDTIHFKW